MAVKNQFYTTIVTPLDITPDGQEPAAREIWRGVSTSRSPRRMPPTRCRRSTASRPRSACRDCRSPPAKRRRGTFQIYAGPKFYSRLDRLGHEEEKVMDFGKFKVVSIALLAMMNTFKSWLGNYGLAIILLTLIVKGVLFPLQNKANKSMKRMSALQPKMAELREKYKDDPARINTETMKLYKEHGVNPLGGCLPMLIQMPIFFGFLYMLYTAAELRNAHFLWVHDLSQPDTVAHFLREKSQHPAVVHDRHAVLADAAHAQERRPLAAEDDDVHAAALRVLLLQPGGGADALLHDAGLLTILQLYLTRSQAPPTLESGGAAAKPVPVRRRPRRLRRRQENPKRLNT